LFQREFILASIRGSAMNGQAVVVYRGDIVLRLPIRATNLCPESPRLPASKLSFQAIRDLIRLAAPGERTSPVAIGENPAVEPVEDAADAAPVSSHRAAGDAP
jgi:hypothetical protein